ncbi:nuclear transport factor 2 family protein [Fodinibius sp. Rm-B-1B1-1]|uniref:nuclear transport factor 2 family protein n=1 Tax=Fodinibius alkaliphilus TaxID=3140241 RepID=UPI003159CF10
MDRIVYKMTVRIISLVIVGILVGCSSGQQKSQEMQKKSINTVLDDWHLAASEANAERYFSHFASDSAIFMGTDATERWTIWEFEDWASPYFDEGQAWDFTPVERHVYLSDGSSTAWFDESLDTPNLGPVRGSGVLVKKDKNWKIAHYIICQSRFQMLS